MISTWLGTKSLEWFLASRFHQEPLLRPSAARACVPLLGWRTIDALIRRRADMLVVRNGVLHEGEDPATYRQARDLFEQGYSLVLRGCDELDPGLRSLAQRVAAELPGEVAVQVFVTPAGFCSFGWHYDCEDVFIVQTGGRKEYRLRRNTVNPRPTLDAMPRDLHFEREFAPVLACTLVPGDWLYIPRGWWHMAHASEDSLSLSVGVLSPDARGIRASPGMGPSIAHAARAHS